MRSDETSSTPVNNRKPQRHGETEKDFISLCVLHVSVVKPASILALSIFFLYKYRVSLKQEADMFKKSVVALIFALAVASVGTAQDAKTVINNVSKAMGYDQLKSI